MATTPQPNQQILGGHSHRQESKATNENPLLSARIIGQGTRCVVMLPGWFGDHNVYQPMLSIWIPRPSLMCLWIFVATASHAT